MSRNELIRPVHAEARRRRAAGFAILTGGLLVVIATVSLFGGKRHPEALANGSNSLGAVREAQSAAKNAESDVATFLAAMKAQRAVPKESDAHALDWNWAPELRRNKNIRNWVGSDWVKPLAGDREIERIAAPQFGAGKDRLAAARSSAGLAFQLTSGHSTDQLPHMPSLKPLHYFSGGKTAGSDDWNTRDAIKLAKHSVDYVQNGGHVQMSTIKRSLVVKSAHATGSTDSSPATGAVVPKVNTATTSKEATAIAKSKDVKVGQVSMRPETENIVAVPLKVIAKEKLLQAQIAKLQSDIKKAKSA